MGRRCDFKIRRSVISYLIIAEWNSIRLSGFLLLLQYLHAADDGAGILNLGPLAIFHQDLADLYSNALWTFIYFKDRKMRHFWGDGQPLGFTVMIDREGLNLHYRWSFSKGRGTKIKHSSEEMRKYRQICHDSCNQTKAYEAYSYFISFLSIFNLLSFPSS